MDIITQGVAGALLAQLAVKDQDQRLNATIAGAFAGVLPDADILIMWPSDPLLQLEYHRHFTHSLFFIPVGGAIAAGLLWRWMQTRAIEFYQLLIFCLLGYSAGGLLDACTSYGTHLFWPVSDTRVAWNLLPVVEPVFTLALVVTLILTHFKKQARYAAYGLGFAWMYILLAYGQQQSVVSLQQHLAKSRGHEIERSVVKPTLGNIILWRSVYLYNGKFYVDAIRPMIFDRTHIYPGGSIEQYKIERRTLELAVLSKPHEDIMRFQTLSNDYLVTHPDDASVIGDIRYAMLPNGTAPLWGIRAERSSAQEHVEEVTFRKSDEETRQQFLKMLMGDTPKL